jgi:hypothetical protein
VIYLLRGTFISLVPVAFAATPMVQVLAMGAVLIFFSVLQSRLWPWRTTAANLSDLGINFALLLCIMGASFLVPVEQGYGERVLGEFLFAAVIMVFAVTASAFVHLAYRRLIPAAGYGAFLCHHKGGAAVLGRYFKVKIGQLTAAQVFLSTRAILIWE